MLTDPAITAIKSTLAAGNEQGQIIGAISAVQAIAGGLGPAMFNGLYSMCKYTSNHSRTNLAPEWLGSNKPA